MSAFPDADSFRPFVEETFRPLASFARSVLGSDLEAEDVAQEALVRLYRERARLDAGRSPRSYLYRIALRLCVSRLRRESRRRALSLLFAPLSPSASAPPADPLDGWFRELPQRQRAIAHLHFGEDLDAPEIAATLGIAASTVRVQLTRIRRSLRSAGNVKPATERCPDVT
ncbi:MAG TPA: sigma-70 family RNA polymerase sigma factor [Thermoanaerobaculia bacterium]|nr:sigma-70 family RNA polymerase sigma factor [Thermoanaerobaculia bacterium]